MASSAIPAIKTRMSFIFLIVLSLRQLEDEELPWFGRVHVVGVVELSAAIKGVGRQRQPVRQGNGQVGACQNHITAARRATGPAEDKIGSRQVEGSKLRLCAPRHQHEIRAAVGGLPSDSRRETET